MRDIMWIRAAVILLVSEAWSLDPVIRNLNFNLGRAVNLTCSDKAWNETIYVIWKIQLKYRNCEVSFSIEDQSKDTCGDGKSLRNSSTSRSYLHIPKFSAEDVGVYKCDFVFSGGNQICVIHVGITAPPTISAWLERRDNKVVAVCRAERGKPAAYIKWSHSRNSSSVETLERDGFITVESRLELEEGMDTENLTCAVRHTLWEQERILVPEHEEGYFPWLLILTGVGVCVILVGFVYFLQKKVMLLRRCQKSDTSSSKTPPRLEDVEEVEPYASYIQRVNSIYN
ncbi:cell surface glycoprotein CD200 receptor 1-B isoform X2 [Scophthalmus maximus]|uniref:cell surface glycoprotein CD200 receptor 1-B isoform X2 n=1 Tax=Scophthalmus maximus TaxID=52904 RepID=UPI000F3252C6|nr:cell surface glycoprotein CD200 receptor 1-B isoform X2 [Scophthalmus maximus]